MPLIQAWQPFPQVHALIWKITEDEAYFINKTGYKSQIRSDIKRVEHIAGRYLLQQLCPELDIHSIYIDKNGKPFSPQGPHFSISHSWPYVLVGISYEGNLGIDLQVTSDDKILIVKDRFLSPLEQEIIGNKTQNICLAWSAKESAYKWLGIKDIAFKSNIPIVASTKHIDINIIHNNINKLISVAYMITSDYITTCAYI